MQTVGETGSILKPRSCKRFLKQLVRITIEARALKSCFLLLGFLATFILSLLLVLSERLHLASAAQSVGKYVFVSCVGFVRSYWLKPETHKG